MPFQNFKKEQAFIDGQWVGADDGAVFPVLNPATGQVIGSVPAMGEAETQRAITAAFAAFKEWAALTGKERAAFLQKYEALIREYREPLSLLLTAEQGKPLAEARAEVAGAADTLQWHAEEAKRLYGDFVPAHKRDARIIVERQPVGVVAAITPWNFPCAMVLRKIAPALAAGCTVVLKPAEDTPLSALALAVLAQEAGLPRGVLNVVTCPYENAPAVGAVLTGDVRVRKVTFTGSTEVGRILMRQSAALVKKISLELGGNAPFIVFEDADFEKALKGALASKSRNAGQTCVSANRIYVHSSLYRDFKEAFVARFAAMKTGDGMDEKVSLGPLINAQATEKVKDLLGDALAKGAELECGGKLLGAGGCFFEPTVLSSMSDTMRITHEEVFGPLAALYSFESEEEVIRRANATEYGLAAYIYTRDLARAFRVPEQLEYGMVAVNEPFVATELAPFGGVKQSGIGREGGRYGIFEFTEEKYILMGGVEAA